jgi:two-component system, NarL family, sensor kinase
MANTRDRVLAHYLAPASLLLIAVLDGLGLWWFLDSQTPSALDITFVLSATLISPVVGVLVVRRHPRHAVGWLLIAHGVLNAPIIANDGWSSFFGHRHTHLWAAALEQQISQAIWPTLYLCIMLVAYVFPDGHFLSRAWRRWTIACLAGYALFMVAATFDLDRLDAPLRGVPPPLPNLPTYIAAPFGFLGLATIMASLIGAAVCARARLRRAEGAERTQMLWFAWAALSVPLGLAMCWLDYFSFGGGTAATLIGVILATSALPIGIGVAILRSRLFDIEVVLSRTLTYGALTGLVVGVYAAVLAGVGALLDNRSVAGFLGVVLVAVVIQPVHARLRRRAERWVYGDRSDPYAALRRLSDRLEATADPAQTLHIVTTSIAEALRVNRVRVRLDGDDVVDVVEGREVRVPLVHQDTRLGELVVDVPRGRQLSAADRQLLDDLARHAAVVVNALHLTLDLQQSRARLVTAREEERRRLRRDLHDGVGPSLAAMVLKLNVLGVTVDDPSSTELLGEVREETKAAIGEIRRLVDDLRPPALDEVGLLGALRQKAVSLSAHGGDDPLVVEVHGPDPLPPLPAAAEVAAYRIAMEAITNVVRHAGATRCVVTVAVNGALELSVTDNGHGPGADAQPGVGLASMRERADELGGSCSISRTSDAGTAVQAVIPLPQSASVPQQPVEPVESVESVDAAAT